MKLFKSQKGFTLIELLIVIAVLGILAALVVPNVMGFIASGKVAAANTELASMQTAGSAYYADNNAYPANSSALGTQYYTGVIKLVGGYTFNASGVPSPASLTNITYDGTVIHWDGTKFIK